MEDQTPITIEGTDILYQEFRLYIEGVQVPFASINISTGLGILPTAAITVPITLGITDISRNYKPKVLVTFIDINSGEELLLFRGNICGTNYYKDSEGSTGLTFRCESQMNLLNAIRLDYSGINKDAQSPDTQAGANGELQMLLVNSQLGTALAIGGITDIDQYQSVDSADAENPDFVVNLCGLDPYWEPFLEENRYKGVPGMLVNLWNQAKYQARKVSKINDPMLKMYLPLAEVGVRFFQRMSGHPSLESLIDTERERPCDTAQTSTAYKFPDKVVIPPSFKMLYKDAVAAFLAMRTLQSTSNYSNEKMGLLEWYQQLLEVLEYDMVVLSSPVMIEGATEAIETIVKPQLPFYYSPMCNIVYPYMYSSLEINQEDSSMPTRVNVLSPLPATDGRASLSFRAPHSVRAAISKKSRQKQPGDPVENKDLQLIDSLALTYNAIGKYEWGQGIRSMDLVLPDWLAMHSATSAENPTKAQPDASNNPAGQEEGQPQVDGAKQVDPNNPDSGPTTKSDVQYNEGESFSETTIKNARAAWEAKYGSDFAGMNPFEDTSKNGLKPYQRIMVSSADYYLTRHMASVRGGSLNGVFNPYIVPGYPMDIVDITPDHPSWHAFCTSVTHTITGNSVGTSVQFTAAMTFDEMYTINQPYLAAWLQEALGLIENVEDQSSLGVVDTAKSDSSSANIINNARGFATADDFYLGALGVGAVAPELLYNFASGTPMAVGRKGSHIEEGSESHSFSGASETNPYLSTRGNLFLASRPIESLYHFSKTFNLTFLPLNPDLYNTTNTPLRNFDDVKAPTRQGLEPGQSQYLSYTKIPKQQEYLGASDVLVIHTPYSNADQGASASGLLGTLIGSVIGSSFGVDLTTSSAPVVSEPEPSPTTSGTTETPTETPG